MLKVGSADITDGQFIKMEADGDVVGVSSGVASGNLLKVKDGVSLTNGQFVKIDSNGKIVSDVPPDTQPLTTDQVKTAMETIIKYTEPDTNPQNRLVEIIQPAFDSSNPAETLLTLKTNGITCGIPLTTSQIISNKLTSKTNASLILQRDGDDKITFDDALTTITDNTKITGDIEINSNLDTTNQNLFLKRSGTAKISIGAITTTLNPKPITGGGQQTGAVKIFGVLHINSLLNNDTDKTLNLGCKIEQNAFWLRFKHDGSDSGSSVTGHRSIAVGQIFAYGQVEVNNVVLTSDGRVKTQEKLIENATDTLMKVVPKSYMKHPSHRVDYDDERPVDLDASGNKIEQKKEYGVVAQELELIDEFKHMINKPSPEMPDTLSVDYTQFIPYLIKSIQELNQRIVELEKKINVD